MKLSIILALAIGLSACGGGGGSRSNNTTPSTPPPAGSNSSAIASSESEVATGLVRRNYALSDINRLRSITLTIGENDVSFMVNLSSAGKSSGIAIKALVAPDGVELYTGTDDGDLRASTFTRSSVSGIGDASLVFPLIPGVPLTPGDYRLDFVTQYGVALDAVNVLVKSIAAGENIDMAAHVLDLNVLAAHVDTNLYGAAALQTLMDMSYRDVIDRVLMMHNLRLGQVRVTQASAADIESFSDLVIETESAGACRSALSADGSDLALNLVFVNNLSSNELGAGGIAGVSPGPGVINAATSNDTCFFVSQAAYDVATGLSLEQSVGMQGGNILHEAGHFMGLPHTTEEQGNEFDLFSDTPQCDAATYDGADNTMFNVSGERDGSVSDHECGIAGGAKNFLFYAGHPDFLPYEMSAEQAWAIRRHPLARPAP